MEKFNPWRFCIAPMLDWTDRHCRYFHRTLSTKARVYTEMVSTGALRYGDQARHLDFSEAEHPIAIQLGGSDPQELAFCAKLAEKWGYDEVNLNCGCPSPKVQKGAFGAWLMSEPKLTADCAKAMMDACSLPVTIKHRIGIDKREDYEFVRDFVGTLFDTGVRVFIVHARNAWLKGLSPKENRSVPPLRREVVYQLKKDFPEATIVMNGGLQSLEDAERELEQVDGVMLGKAAYSTPWVLSDVDARLFFSENKPVTREDIVEKMSQYLKTLDDPSAIRAVCRHMHGLMTGLAGAKSWRSSLSEWCAIKAKCTEILRYAYAKAGWRDVEDFWLSDKFL
ncbi:MAG: tRNA dihydrouridine(20/20a) synthase DusA [Burkholderiales bacterium]|nr:tRNA dihydrouridine(20/20a) synthase DusA [Burkholderiales bacterium]